MKLVKNVVVGAVVLGLFSMVSPVIKESTGNLITNAGNDASHAISTVAENGGFSNTWNSITKLGSDIFNEATNSNHDDADK